MLQDNLVSIHYFTDDRQTPVDIESADFEFETLRTSYCIRDVPDAASFVSVRCKGEANFKSTIVSDVRSSSRTLPLDTSPLSWRKAGDNYHQAYLADRLEVVLQTGRTVYRLCFDRSDATDLSAYLLDENFAPVAQAHSRLKGPSPSTALVLPGREADAKYISFAVTRLSGVPVSFSCENGGPLAVWSEGPASSSAIFELSARSARPLSFQLADEQAWTASVAVTLPTYAVFPERERSCGRGGAGEAAGAPEVTEVAGRAVSFRCDDIDKYDVETDPISEFQLKRHKTPNHYTVNLPAAPAALTLRHRSGAVHRFAFSSPVAASPDTLRPKPIDACPEFISLFFDYLKTLELKMLEEANQRGRILRPPLSEQHDKTPHPAYLPVLQHDSQYHETFGFKPQLYDGYRWANHRPVLLPQSNKKTQMVFVLQPNDGAQDWIEGDGEWSASAGSKWLYLADAVSVFTIWCVLFW